MNESMNTMMDAIRIMLHRYNELEKKVGERYGLSGGEMAVLAFLINNPGKDTASDVCYGRMMKKGNVSFLVTSLEMKGLMGKRIDEKDKRKSRFEAFAPGSNSLYKEKHKRNPKQNKERVFYHLRRE